MRLVRLVTPGLRSIMFGLDGLSMIGPHRRQGNVDWTVDVEDWWREFLQDGQLAE